MDNSYCFMIFLTCIVFVIFNNLTYNFPYENIKQNPVYRHFLKYIEPTITLDEVHTNIWNQIEFLQEKGNCVEKKILHCENIGSYAGLGSMMMRYGACMQVAFSLGRIFFIEQKEYAHFGGLFRFLKNESSRCGHLKNTYRSSKSICNLHQPDCYLDNGYDVNNTYQVVVYNTNMKYPAPRAIPGTLPLEIEKVLRKHNIDLPWLWFTSQFLGYLMLRLQPNTEKLIETFKLSMNFSFPYTALHIRHGKDKIGHESVYIENEKYIRWVDKYSKQFLQNTTLKIYAASDDKDILSQLRKVRPNIKYMQLPREYADRILPKYKTDTATLIYKTHNFPKEVIESIIIEQNFLTYANFTVCFLSSNVCRLQWSLKLATPPYRFENRIISVDGYSLNYYWWFGYIASKNPFVNHFVPVRAFTGNVSFPDGKKMMTYTLGTLIILRGGIKFMTVNNVIYSVRWGNTVHRRNGNLAGYVSVDDIVRWPGRPSYHFYN